MSDLPEVKKQQEGNITVAGQRGSYFVTQHTEREVKVYAVFENELKTISIFNWITALFASMGTGILAFMAGLLVNAAINPVAQPAIFNAVCWICGILGVVCFAIAGTRSIFENQN